MTLIHPYMQVLETYILFEVLYMCAVSLHSFRTTAMHVRFYCNFSLHALVNSSKSSTCLEHVHFFHKHASTHRIHSKYFSNTSNIRKNVSNKAEVPLVHERSEHI